MQMHCLQRRLRNTNVSITSVHPGMVDTEIGRDFVESKMYEFFKRLNRLIGKNSFYRQSHPKLR